MPKPTTLGPSFRLTNHHPHAIAVLSSHGQTLYLKGASVPVLNALERAMQNFRKPAECSWLFECSLDSHSTLCAYRDRLEREGIAPDLVNELKSVTARMKQSLAENPKASLPQIEQKVGLL